MKTMYLVVLLSLISADICLGQSYRPFINNSAHWTFQSSYCGQCPPYDQPPCITDHQYHLKIGGDTTINSRSYKKMVMYQFDTLHDCTSNSAQTYPCGFVGLLWEDTTAKKVFIKTAANSFGNWQPQDTLLFDFSKGVGDTLKFQVKDASYLGNPNTYVIDSVTYCSQAYINIYPFYTPLPLFSGLGGQSIKRWVLRCTDTNYANPIELYEGIGASFGFYLYDGIALRKYAFGTDSEAGFECSQSYNGIHDTENNDMAMDIYPNPTSDQLFIETNGKLVEQINIFNTTGKLIYQSKLSQGNNINISHLPNGIYIAEVKTKEAIVKRRWVKM